MDTKKILTCRGSFGGYETTTCFQLDQAATIVSKPPECSTLAATDPRQNLATVLKKSS
jgi:hypothetical protein